jgi:hypothetical protein
VRPTGKVNLIGLTLLLGLGAGIYSIVIFGSVYTDNMDVTDAVRSAFNQVGQRPEGQILAELQSKLDRIGTHRELNENGVLVEVRGLGVGEEGITFEKNPATNEYLVQVRYVREVRLKPTKRWVKVRFSPSKKGIPPGAH